MSIVQVGRESGRPSCAILDKNKIIEFSEHIGRLQSTKKENRTCPIRRIGKDNPQLQAVDKSSCLRRGLVVRVASLNRGCSRSSYRLVPSTSLLLLKTRLCCFTPVLAQT